MLIQDLGNQGEVFVKQNIRPGEQIIAKVKGISGEGIVLTDKCVYLLKWGGLSGSTFGVGKGIGSFNYKEIMDVAMRKYLLTSTLEFTLKSETKISDINIVTGSVKNFFAKVFGGNTPLEDYVRTRIVTFGRGKVEILNELLRFIKRQMTS